MRLHEINPSSPAEDKLIAKLSLGHETVWGYLLECMGNQTSFVDFNRRIEILKTQLPDKKDDIDTILPLARRFLK